NPTDSPGDNLGTRWDTAEDRRRRRRRHSPRSSIPRLPSESTIRNCSYQHQEGSTAPRQVRGLNTCQLHLESRCPESDSRRGQRVAECSFYPSIGVSEEVPRRCLG